MLQKCKIIDTTLREGEQTPGVLFSITQKKRIIDGLGKIGIQEIELGVASPLITDLYELLYYCKASWPTIQTSLWCRCKDTDIRHALALAPDVLSLSIPVSDIHLNHKINKNKTWAMQTLITSIALAQSYGAQVAIGFEDATRADMDFLVLMAKAAEQAGAFRIRFADTVGTASPGSIQTIISNLRKELSTAELAVHTHNDFGMATANAVSAIEHGASWIDATVLGLGERCGCARLEEIVAYLNLVRDNLNFKVEELKPLAQYVAQCSSSTIPASRPILGSRIFTCETGLHLQGLQHAPQTYEPYAPEMVGATRELLFGAKAGKRALTHHLKQLGHDLTPLNIQTSLHTIRNTARSFHRPLTDQELQHLLSTS